MPTIWTTCPQCQRPLETDCERDGLVISCPCCDAEVPVPQPWLGRVPNLVWLAAGLGVMLPLSNALGFLVASDHWPITGPSVFLAIVMGVPSYFLVRGYFSAWIAFVVLGSLVCYATLLALLYSVVIYVFTPNWSTYLGMSLLPLIVSSLLMTVLLLKPVRDWCQRDRSGR